MGRARNRESEESGEREPDNGLEGHSRKKEGRKKKGKRRDLVPRVAAQHHVAGGDVIVLIDAARA